MVEKVLKNIYEVLFKALNRHSLRKQNFIRGNCSPFLNKNVSKAMMSQITRNFGKQSKHYFRITYNHQAREYCQKKSMVTDGNDIAETLISYFTNVVKTLETPDSEKIDQFYE